MRFVGKTVTVWLNLEGQHALSALLAGTEPLRLMVFDEDQLGIWGHISQRPGPTAEGEEVLVLLIRWDYIATAELEYIPENPESWERQS